MSADGTEGLGFLIHDAARLLRKRFEQKASATGLSSAQWRLLVRVAKEPGVTQARLAELLEIEPISVSRLIDRMEGGDWIERRADSADRRVRLIYPTEKSLAAFNEVKSVAGEVFDAALAGLGKEERVALIRALETMVNNLGEPTPVAQAPVEPAQLKTAGARA